MKTRSGSFSQQRARTILIAASMLASTSATAAPVPMTPVQNPLICPPAPVDSAAIPCFSNSGLTAWWHGDGDANDMVAGRTGALMGGATIGMPAVRGKAFQLNTTAQQKRYVEVPHDPALNLGAGDFTISLWVRFNNTTGEQVLIEKWVQQNPPDGWTLTKLANQKLHFAGSDGGQVDLSTEAITFATGKWYHIAATRSGGQLALYLNGIARACGPLAADLDSPTALLFGRRAPDSFHLRGQLDEIQIWAGTALNPIEIAALWAFHLAGTGVCTP